MGTEDYTTATSGSLKLKGVKGSRVEKQKKKKKRVKDEQPTNPSKEIKREADAEEGKETEVGNGREVALRKALDEELDDPQDKEQFQGVGKTEAERRHEERRRKRLDERLKREGVKTHKERVEELNRYLSNLSEHHDMPRIGPG